MKKPYTVEDLKLRILSRRITAMEKMIKERNTHIYQLEEEIRRRKVTAKHRTEIIESLSKQIVNLPERYRDLEKALKGWSESSCRSDLSSNHHTWCGCDECIKLLKLNVSREEGTLNGRNTKI